MADFEVRAITEGYCDELYSQFDLNPVLYTNKPKAFPLETKNELFAKGSTMIYLKLDKFKEFKIEVKDDESNKTQNDLNNSIVLYKSLVYRNSDGVESFLSPLQASDKRIWNFLAHHDLFWTYVNNRWGGDKPSKRRFILNSINQSNLLRHSLSRLWWYAELCYDKENTEDPFVLLKTLCTNSDTLYSIQDRSWNANRFVLHALLKFMSIPQNKDLLKAEKIKEVVKILTTETGIRDLPMLEPKELELVLSDLFA